MAQPIKRPIFSNEDFKDGQKIRETLNEYRRYFSRKDVIEAGHLQAQATLEWLATNDQSYSAKGDLEEKPWWPVPQPTSSVILKVTRQRTLYDRAYGHGIYHFLYGLGRTGWIERINSDQADIVVEAATPVVLKELVAHRHSPDSDNGVSLTKLSQLYGNGVKTPPKKIRDRCLGIMVMAGLYQAREFQGYDISVGEYGDIFYTKVFVPIVEKMDINYKGDSDA